MYQSHIHNLVLKSSPKSAKSVLLGHRFCTFSALLIAFLKILQLVYLLLGLL